MKRKVYGNHRGHPKGQVLLEFAFCMIALMVLVYGTVMAFRWCGMSLVGRSSAHWSVLTREVRDDFENNDPVRPDTQVSISFERPARDGFDFVMPNDVIYGE